MGPAGFLVWADPSLTVEIHAGIDYVRTVELGVVDHYRQVTLTCPTARSRHRPAEALVRASGQPDAVRGAVMTADLPAS